MKSWYRVFPKSLTVEQCAEVCRIAEKFELKPSTVGFGSENRQDQQLRKSGIRWIPRTEPKMEWLYRLIECNVRLANRENFDLIDITDFNDVQFTIYRGDEQGHYGWHQDNARLNTDGRQWDRKISVCIQLSEIGAEEPPTKSRKRGATRVPKGMRLTRYQGGEFWINPSRQMPVPEFKDAGDMLIFPSDLWHEVRPVTAGTRRSLVTWFNGPRWR